MFRIVKVCLRNDGGRKERGRVVRAPGIRSCLCGLLCLLAVAGCGPQDQRQGLEGTVVLDATPLATGHIVFRPQRGTSGPSSGAKIVDGQFVVGRDDGPLPGTFRVEITDHRKTGRTKRDPDSGKFFATMEQYLPERYNRNSELTAEVKAGEENHFEFTLTSR